MGSGVWGAAVAGAWFALCASAAADGYGDFNNGVAAANREEYADAVTLLTSAISSPDLPTHLLPSAHLARGAAYNAQGQNMAAINDFTVALTLRKDYLDAYLDRCRTYEALKNFAPALADCTAAIQLQPDNWRLYEIRIGIEQKAGRFDDALADFSRFVAQRPNDVGLLLGRAEAYRTAGKLDEALADANAAAKKPPKLGFAELELGQIYFSQDNLPKALASFDDSVTLGFKNPIAYLLKGQMEWAMGRFDDAEDSFENSLKQDALRGDAFLWLSITQAHKGSKPDEQILARFAKADLPPWPGAVIQLYLGKTTPDEVLKTSDTLDVRCHADFLVGEWYATQGNSAAAKSTLQHTAQSCGGANNIIRKFAAIDLGRMP